MLIGPGVNQLEQRITDALCSGSLRLKESAFLQGISRKIGFCRERASLSDAQASWPFRILTRFERGMTSRSSMTRRPLDSARAVARQHSSQKDASESPQLMRVLAGLDGYTWANEPLSSTSSWSVESESE